MPTVNELIDKAKVELTYLMQGEVFLVRGLFKGYEWNRISKSDRLLQETLVLNYIKTNLCKILPVKKTSSGQQKYRVERLEKGG